MPPVPQVTGCRTHGQIALTYSEGPSDATAKIVRQLNNAQVRANFFINTTWLYTQQYAMVVQNMYNAGHLIGMTYRAPQHEDGSSYTDGEIRQDVINSAKMVETLIHVAPKYVRLHYSDPEDTRTENIIKDLGFVLVDHNLDSMDYLHKTGPKIQSVYRNAFIRQKDTYDAKGSFISVQYDIPGSGSLAAVPFIIQTIDEEGYTAVRMDGCLNDPEPYKSSADSLEYVSDKFSFNTTGYKQGQKPVAIVSNATEVDEQGLSAEDEQDGFLESKANATLSYLVLTASLAFLGAITQLL
ncbi:hypothetical protein BDB00DRAFT_767037 [Zychaea mexicana]|uniref:uncharacterized protein n=1 Tax=Zychaea mexicana TaxID=64656 RepID=UPI0022FF1613|nr:uncharacterized protein BDB00DRAFT_767037 [Zychaea mexicana]KAI9491444.1 hypothetical protein BDB00DRAFT_767037 [Zychaea mexicana]